VRIHAVKGAAKPGMQFCSNSYRELSVKRSTNMKHLRRKRNVNSNERGNVRRIPREN
jgi:hypothetical protein